MLKLLGTEQRWVGADLLALALYPLKLLERCLPAPLQLAADDAVLGLHRQVVTFGSLGRVARPFYLVSPVPPQRFAFFVRVVIGKPRRFPRARPGGLQKNLHHRLVDALAADNLTVRPAVLSTSARAAILIHPPTALATVTQPHASTTVTTQHQPLQQRSPFPRGSLRLGLVLMTHHHIPPQPLLIRLIAFKADIGRMMVANQHRPVSTLTPLMVDACRAFGVETAYGLAFTKDVGTGVDGIV